MASSSQIAPARPRTLVVCVDAEGVDLSRGSTLAMLYNLLDRNSGQIITYYTSPTILRYLYWLNSPTDYWWRKIKHTSIVRDLVAFAYRFLVNQMTGDASEAATSVYIFGSGVGGTAALDLATMVFAKGIHQSQDIHDVYDNFVKESKTGSIKIIRSAVNIELVGLWGAIQDSTSACHHLNLDNFTSLKVCQALPSKEPFRICPSILYLSQYAALWFEGTHSDLIGASPHSEDHKNVAHLSVLWMAHGCQCMRPGQGIRFRQVEPITVTIKYNTPIIRKLSAFRFLLQLGLPKWPVNFGGDLTWEDFLKTKTKSYTKISFQAGLPSMQNHMDANMILSSQDEEQRTQLSLAAERGDKAMVQLLLERRDVMVELLLEKGGASINSPGRTGRTPLSFAAGSGHEAVVKLLLEQDGVDINSKDDLGRTPLSYAAEFRHEVVMKLLLEKLHITL